MKLKKVKFIQNPKSGLIQNAAMIKSMIERNLSEATFKYDFVETQYKGHGNEMAKEAAAKGYDVVVAIGGDGTMNEIASALVNTNTALAVIPTGSGNGLAIGLGIPVSIRRATHLLIDGQIRTIDAGLVNGKYFFILNGMGFDAIIGKLFDQQSIRGPLPYFTIGIREAFRYKPEMFILKFNGKQIAMPALFVTVANLRGWGAGATIAPGAKPDDGYLDIGIIRRVKLWYAFLHLYKIFTGEINKVQKYEHYRTKHVEIIREKPGPYHIDGEPFEGGTHFDISVVPNALRVVCPK